MFILQGQFGPVPCMHNGNAKANGNIITSHALKLVLRCQAKRVAPRNKDTVGDLTATSPLWKAATGPKLYLHQGAPPPYLIQPIGLQLEGGESGRSRTMTRPFLGFVFTTSLFFLPAMLVFICQHGGIMTVL